MVGSKSPYPPVYSTAGLAEVRFGREGSAVGFTRDETAGPFHAFASADMKRFGGTGSGVTLDDVQVRPKRGHLARRSSFGDASATVSGEKRESQSTILFGRDPAGVLDLVGGVGDAEAAKNDTEVDFQRGAHGFVGGLENAVVVVVVVAAAHAPD